MNTLKQKTITRITATVVFLILVVTSVLPSAAYAAEGKTDTLLQYSGTLSTPTTISEDVVLDNVTLSSKATLTLTGSSDPNNPMVVQIKDMLTIATGGFGIKFSGNVKIIPLEDNTNTTVSIQATTVNTLFRPTASGSTLTIENIHISGPSDSTCTSFLLGNTNLHLSGNTSIVNFTQKNSDAALFGIEDPTACVFLEDQATISNNNFDHLFFPSNIYSNIFSMTGGTIKDNTFQVISPTASSFALEGGTIIGGENQSALYFSDDTLFPADLADKTIGTLIQGKVQFASDPNTDYYYVSNAKETHNNYKLSRFDENTENLYQIKVTEINGGELQTSPFNYAPTGTPVTVIPVAENDSYKLSSLSYTIDSKEEVPITKDENGNYSFTMPDNDITISAEFKQNESHSVSISSPTNGSIFSDKDSAPENDTVTLTVTPYPTYRLEENSLKITAGESNIEYTENADGTFSFKMPDSDVTISAEFEKLPTHKIEAVDADGGSLTFAPSGDAWKTEDNSYYYTDTVTIQPEFEPGYILTGIKAVSGEAELELTKDQDSGCYTFTMPDGDVTVTAEYSKIASAGNGTAASPYQISSVKELESFRDAVNSGISFERQYLELINDISIPQDGNNSNWVSIGLKRTFDERSHSYPFSGTFDGGGHSIQGLYIIDEVSDADSRAALFGLADGAVIKDLTVSGTISVAKQSNAGMISEAADTSISGCTSGLSITARDNVGGIVGNASGKMTISGCSNNGSLMGKGSVGGIVGLLSTASEAMVSECTNTGNVNHQSPGGGIIANCTSSTGSVTVQKCSNSGKIAGSISSGGIVCYTPEKGTLTIDACYNTGNVASSYASGFGATAGGIISKLSSGTICTMSSCYSVGEVNATYDDSHSNLTYSHGQLIGYLDSSKPTITNSYYVRDFSGSSSEVPTVTVGEKVSEEDLKNLADGITLTEFTTDGAGVNDGWPVLDWQSEQEYITLKITGQGDAAAGITVSGNGAEISKDGARFVKGSVVALEITLSNEYSKYTIDSVSSDQQDLPFTRITRGVKLFIVLDSDSNMELSVTTRLLQEDEVKPDGNKVESTVPSSQVWDGITADLSWFDPAAYEETDTYEISTPQQLAGLAALVNGLVNEDCELYLWKGHGLATQGNSTNIVSAATWNASKYVNHDEGNMSGGNGLNQSTEKYAYGSYDFKDKTILLTNDIDMGADYDGSDWSGPNYMPIGGQYLMKDEDTSTKISSSFNGTFDGGGHYVYNIYCDRHCTTNFGDGQSVGLIGRLGCHDSDPADMRADSPAVRDVAVTGYIHANRSLGGIVGKIGKTNDGGVISGCANYATIIGTDAKGTGGIVGAGWNYSTIKDCFNIGTVTGGWPAGGIVGSNESDVTNCYNAGTVSSAAGVSYGMAIGTNQGGTLKNSYYLKDSGEGGGYYNALSSDEFGEKEANEMKSAEFADLLGDAFVQDTQNNNQGYPIFSWQKGKDVSNPDSSGVTPPQIIGDIEITTGTGGKVTIDKEDVKTGDTVTLTAVPEQGYAVDTVTVTDKDGKTITVTEKGSGVYSFVKPDGKVKIKVTFKKTQISAIDNFTDVSSADWFYDAVSYAVSEGLFNGVSDTQFAPNSNMTRAMFVTVLGRLAKVDTSKYSGDSFTDVEKGSWYDPYVQWASENGIVNGVSDGVFRPNGQITREQMAAILYRFAKFSGIDTAVSDESAFLAFPDNASVSSYARESMIWAVSVGIINGTGTGLSPQNNATRAQVAQIMKNYAEKILTDNVNDNTNTEKNSAA